MGGNARINNAAREVNVSLERLATGKRINRASDDPSDMIAVSDLDASIKSIEARIKGVERSRMQYAARDGAESEFSAAFVEMQGLLTAAANRGAMTIEERSALQDQFDGLLQGMQFVANTFRFGGEQMFAGRDIFRSGSQTVNIGGEATSVSLKDLQRGGKLNLVDGDLSLAQQVLDAAASNTNSTRAAAGNMAKQADSTLNTLRVELEELTGIRSSIEDTDYGKETANLVRNQLMQEASVRTRQLSMNSQRETVFALLAGVAR